MSVACASSPGAGTTLEVRTAAKMRMGRGRE